MVGDLVGSYAEVVRVGRTSVAVQVEIWVRRADHPEPVKVTHGIFTYVALDEHRRPRPVDA
jgi:acyl-CoA thioesterase YciA